MEESAEAKAMDAFRLNKDELKVRKDLRFSAFSCVISNGWLCLFLLPFLYQLTDVGGGSKILQYAR